MFLHPIKRQSRPFCHHDRSLRSISNHINENPKTFPDSINIRSYRTRNNQLLSYIYFPEAKETATKRREHKLRERDCTNLDDVDEFGPFHGAGSKAHIRQPNWRKQWRTARGFSDQRKTNKNRTAPFEPIINSTTTTTTRFLLFVPCSINNDSGKSNMSSFPQFVVWPSTSASPRHRSWKFPARPHPPLTIAIEGYTQKQTSKGPFRIISIIECSQTPSRKLEFIQIDREISNSNLNA